MLAPIYALAAADRMARAGVATAAEIDVADLDPARRTEWTAEQWARAEAAGLVALAAPETPPPSQHSQHSAHAAEQQGWSASGHEPGRTSAEADGPTARLCRDAPEGPTDEPVWWDEEAEEWRTTFPPPAGFTGYAEGRVGHMDYQRCLTEAEEARMGPGPDWYSAEELHAMARERNAFFAPDGRPASDDRVAPVDRDADDDAEGGADEGADPDASCARSLVASRVVALRPADSQFAGVTPI